MKLKIIRNFLYLFTLIVVLIFSIERTCRIKNSPKEIKLNRIHYALPIGTEIQTEKSKESIKEFKVEKETYRYFPKISKRPENIVKKENLPVSEKEIEKEIVIKMNEKKFSLFLTKNRELLKQKNFPENIKIEEVKYYSFYDWDFRKIYLGLSTVFIKEYYSDSGIIFTPSLSYTPFGFFDYKLRLGGLITASPFLFGIGLNYVPFELYDKEKKISALSLGVFYIPMKKEILNPNFVIFLGFEFNL